MAYAHEPTRSADEPGARSAHELARSADEPAARNTDELAPRNTDEDEPLRAEDRPARERGCARDAD